MYLSRFGVKNYKCLGEIDIPLTPIHVLIGENDAGKTSLLEALAAFYASTDCSNLSQAFPGPWEGSELVLHSSPERRIELWGEWGQLEPEESGANPDNFRYGFVVDFPTTGTNCRTPGDWIERGGKHLQLSGRRNPQNTSIERWKAGALDIDDSDANLISSAMNSAHKYALSARLMAAPAAIDPNRKFRLDPDGFGLSTLLDDILGFDPEIFLAVRKAFCEFFPQFKSLRIESEKALRRHYSPNGIHSADSQIGKGIFIETRGSQTIRAQQASDGAILFLGFLALAHIPDPPNLLLIEEPENGIYPKRLGEVIALLKELVHRTEGVRFPQIIMSTHSPYVLSFFEPEEVTFLSRTSEKPDAPVRARPLRDAPNVREGGFYLGELWYNLSEEELFGDA